ncbi:M48 family metallopeptidase [Paralysiella testudinis]|uniref:M48 family metallopeptidase n=1 Tax=Paralysiella testudinis TaxID=2809020 RepID=A0A892ZDU2_9NEIS|nr:M48 family metallopeptidase [Paralysiella testudinis]QRQ81112.1 M48 family metallopeptidase [Paralysiella testudinis]
MQKSQRFALSACRPLATLAVSITLLAGCSSVADMVGYDTHTLNLAAGESYQQVVQEARQKKAIDTTSATARRIQTVFNRLKPFANEANQTGVPFDWQLTVIRSDELNAWAMPGGKMAMYTGLVNKLRLSDAEIAAVIGHEMTHALNEHSKNAVGQQVLTGMALDVGGRVLASKTNINSDVLSTSQNLLSEYGIGKPFSRYQERDADRGGLVLMAKAGYDPNAAITVWEKMNAASGNSGNGLSSLMSTHPSNNARIDDIRKQLPSVMPIYEQSRKR